MTIIVVFVVVVVDSGRPVGRHDKSFVRRLAQILFVAVRPQTACALYRLQ